MRVEKDSEEDIPAWCLYHNQCWNCRYQDLRRPWQCLVFRVIPRAYQANQKVCPYRYTGMSDFF